MTVVERNIHLQVVGFTNKYGSQPNNLYLGYKEYTHLLEEIDCEYRVWQYDDGRTYRGMRLYVVDVVSHLGVG